MGIYRAALGETVLAVRVVSSFLCGIVAGLLIYFIYREKPFFHFTDFTEPRRKNADPNLLLRYLKNLWRNLKTAPLLQQWLWEGMSVGSAASFMLTGPSTKLTNLGTWKIVLGLKHFFLYLAYVVAFSLIAGLIVNAIL